MGSDSTIGNLDGEMGADLPSVNLPAGSVVLSLALSGYLTCAIVQISDWGVLEDPHMVCWGHTWMTENTYQCHKSDGDGYYRYNLGPTVAGSPVPTQVTGGVSHMCVRMSDGTVRCICDGQGYDYAYSHGGTMEIIHGYPTWVRENLYGRVPRANDLTQHKKVEYKMW